MSEQRLTASNILLNPEGPERAAVGPHLERLMDARESMQSVLAKLVSSGAYSLS